jgi:hypothetical protein
VTVADGYRVERIERLLDELRYEIERGMLEREISEELTFRFVVPMSRHFPDGVVCCEFRTRPMLRIDAMGFDQIERPRFEVIEGGKHA